MRAQFQASRQDTGSASSSPVLDVTCERRRAAHF
jgi:hypothetical protein